MKFKDLVEGKLYNEIGRDVIYEKKDGLLWVSELINFSYHSHEVVYKMEFEEHIQHYTLQEAIADCMATGQKYKCCYCLNPTRRSKTIELDEDGMVLLRGEFANIIATGIAGVDITWIKC